MKRTVIEITLFIILALFLSLLFNALSPSGLRILPKKSPQEKQAYAHGTLLSQSSKVLP